MARRASDDPNAVPIEVIRPFVEEWLKKHSVLHPSGGGFPDSYIEDIGHQDGHYHVLAFQSGVHGRTLRGLTNGYAQTKGSNQTHVTFDTADKIVCATVGPMAWYTDERLTPYYGPLAVLYGEVIEGRELPEGLDVDELPPRYQRYWRKAVAA